MFYSFLKVLVRITLKLFFRKIFITGTDHISLNKAQLVASNHPNGFLEPLVMACFFPKPLHFLVRGDVFDNPILKPLLKSTNQIPIFRFRDGFSRLRENSNTIDESLQVLIEKNNLLIFAEGNTESIKKLRPLQKGIAKIAFQTLEKQPTLDLEILPVGINFTNPTQFDKTVMLRIGNPIKVKDYMASYNADKIQGTQHLLDDLFEEMKKNVVHLEDQDRIVFYEKIARISSFNNEKSYLPIFLKTDSNLQNQINLAKNIDALTTEEYNNLGEKIDYLENKIKTAGLAFNDIFLKPITFMSAFWLVLGFLPAVMGLLVHFLPIVLGLWFTNTKVKQKEFRASILMVSILGLILVYYIFLIVLNFIFGWPVYLIPIFIVSGFILRIYYVIWHDTTLKSRKLISFFRTEAIAILDSVLH